MNNAIFKRALRFVGLSFAIILAVGVSNGVLAQREAEIFKIYSNDTVIGLAPGQTLRLSIFNPAPNAAGPHVKVYTGTGLAVLSGSHTPLKSGEFDSFNISYSDLEQMSGEPGTGRRQIRVELAIVYTGLESDARRIRSTYELVDTATGQTILIGMLLPAIQKVR
jgi:hypothetical protein